MDPFGTAKDDDDDKDEEKEGLQKKTRTEQTDEPGLTEHPQAHPTEKGREEQAASIEPEGSSVPSTQQQARENAESGKYFVKKTCIHN